MRINIPSNPGDLIVLAKAINAKHIALGAASPLNGIDGIAGFGAQVTAADTNNQQADLLYKQAETATEARDNALGPDTTTPGSTPQIARSSRARIRKTPQERRASVCGSAAGRSAPAEWLQNQHGSASC